MGFVALTLIAASGFAVGNVLDKVIMKTHVEHPAVKVFWYGMLAPLVGLPALRFGAVTLPSAPVLATILLAGALFVASLTLVMWAMKTGEVSRIALLKQTAPLFVLLFSFLLIGEVLSPQQYVGLGFLLSAGLLATLRHPGGGLPVPAFTRPVRLVTAASAMNGLSAVLVKAALREATVWTVFYGEQVGIFLLSPVILSFGAGIRQDAWALLRGTQPGLSLIAASSAVFAGAKICYTGAMSRASATVVASINTVNPLITLALAIGLKRLGVEAFDEQMRGLQIVEKALAVVLFAAGVYAVR